MRGSMVGGQLTAKPCPALNIPNRLNRRVIPEAAKEASRPLDSYALSVPDQLFAREILTHRNLVAVGPILRECSCRPRPVPQTPAAFACGRNLNTHHGVTGVRQGQALGELEHFGEAGDRERNIDDKTGTLIVCRVRRPVAAHTGRLDKLARREEAPHARLVPVLDLLTDPAIAIRRQSILVNGRKP